MFILDLVFVGLRAILVLFGIFGVIMMQSLPEPDPMIVNTGIWEVLSGVAMVVTGLAASGMMLAKIRAGAYVAIVKVVAVISSYVVSFWQTSYAIANFSQLPEGSPEQVGGYIGLGIGGVFLLIRVALLVAYVFAVLKFLRWVDECSKAQLQRGQY